MKVKVLLILFFVVAFSCKDDDERLDQNPNLIRPLVNLNLNLNLPEYNALLFDGGSVIINSQGIRGIVVYRVNDSFYTAFELSDPNHVPSTCSRMALDGIVTTCPCEDDTNSYNIVTGQHTTQPDLYPMMQYFATRNGNSVIISD